MYYHTYTHNINNTQALTHVRTTQKSNTFFSKLLANANFEYSVLNNVVYITTASNNVITVCFTSYTNKCNDSYAHNTHNTTLQIALQTASKQITLHSANVSALYNIAFVHNANNTVSHIAQHNSNKNASVLRKFNKSIANKLCNTINDIVALHNKLN